MKKLSLLMLIVMLLAVLTGCAASDTKTDESASTSTASLKIMIAAPYVAPEAVESFTADITAALPELNTDAAKLVVQNVSTGDTENDPMGTMAGMAQLTGMMSTGDVELMICDADNARRYAENGESYIPLSQLFTDDEMTELGIKPATVPLLDDEAQLTGEFSGPCGIDLSGSETLKGIFGRKDLGAYVMVNVPNVDNAKIVLTYLAQLP